MNGLKLSYTEFEILQFLTLEGPKRTTQIHKSLSTFNEDDIEVSIDNLKQSNLLIHKEDKLVAALKSALALEPYRVKKAIILAAGRGLRLNPHTQTTPKSLTEVKGRRIIETQIDALIVAGINDITIVRGYLADKFDVLTTNYPNLKFIDNKNWDTLEPIESVNLAKHLLDDAYLIEGDIYIVNPKIIRPYEYRNSYCGIKENSYEDWYFTSDDCHRITSLDYGNVDNPETNIYKYLGVSFWTKAAAKKFGIEVVNKKTKPKQYPYAESVIFDKNSNVSEQDYFVRVINANDAVEIDNTTDFDRLKSII